MAQACNSAHGKSDILISRDVPVALSDRSVREKSASSVYSPASEQLAGLETLVELLVAGRRMQLAMLSLGSKDDDRPDSSTIINQPRETVLKVARRLVSSVVDLGSNGYLDQADISTLRSPDARYRAHLQSWRIFFCSQDG